MSPSAKRNLQRLPVLSISTGAVEWLDTSCDTPIYLRAEVEETTPVRLARAAARMLRENKQRRRPCVLVLGHGMVEHRTVRIAELAPAESRRVLHRKAANLLDASLADTVYAAVPLSKNDGEGQDGSTREWFLLALRRREARALQLELRRLGLRSARVFSDRLSMVAAAATLVEKADEAVISVGVSDETMTISLVTGGELVQTTSLLGNYAENPYLASSLLQELRGFEAFWRKRSRGSSIERVALIGFNSEQAIHLAPALHASLPGAQVETLPLAAGIDDLPVDRVSAMTAAQCGGPFQVDLALPLPPRVPRLVAAAMLAGVATAGVVWKGREHLLSETDRHRQAAESLRVRTAVAGKLDEHYALIEQAMAELGAEQQRQAALSLQGVNLTALLGDTGRAFQGRADMMILKVDATAAGEEVTISGSTEPDPGRSLESLRALERALELGPHFAEVFLKPPTGMPSDRDGGERLLQFSIEAIWEGN